MCEAEYRKKYNQTHKVERAKYDKKRYQTKAGKVSCRRRQFKYLYGLTVTQHKQMYVKQNGCCAICGIPVAYNKIKTDHCHGSGKVRGLLCCRCNHLLAALDDKEFFTNAINYINS